MSQLTLESRGSRISISGASISPHQAPPMARLVGRRVDVIRDPQLSRRREDYRARVRLKQINVVITSNG
jgi:hypothetical protein